MNQHKKKEAGIWVCGAPASGKSRIAEAAILPLGFELIDVDKTYEDLVLKYRLGYDNMAGIDEDKEYVKTVQYARRLAERLSKESKESGGEGLVDPGQFINKLELASGSGKLYQDYARQIVRNVHSIVGTRILPWDSFRKLILPKMSDLDDPLDFLVDKNPVTHSHLFIVAIEITRRHIASSRNEHKNLLFVETGGQTGKLVNLKNALEIEGYKTFLIWIQLDNVEEARKRNEIRRASGGRGLDAAVIERSFQVAQNSRERLLKEFSPHAVEIDNSRHGEDELQDRIREVQTIVGQWVIG